MGISHTSVCPFIKKRKIRVIFYRCCRSLCWIAVYLDIIVIELVGFQPGISFFFALKEHA